MATYLGELQSRTSQNLGAVKEQVEPLVQQASDSTTKKLSEISTLLEAQAENFRTQLETSIKDLSTSMDGKLEEITELISPYATKIREHLENIMDKVKETTTA